MKNILGTAENLELYSKEGDLIYKFNKYSGDCWSEKTFDSNGNILTYKNSSGYLRRGLITLMEKN